MFNLKILKDPQFNLSPKDRRHLIRRATRQWLTKPLNIALYVFTLLGPMIAMRFVQKWLESQGLSNTIITVIQMAVLFPLMFLFIFYLIYRFRFLRLIYQELRDLGHDICPTCGYTLINLPKSETQCPECGTIRTKPADAGYPHSPSSAQ